VDAKSQIDFEVTTYREKSRQDGDVIGKIENIGYRNPSLRLATKVRAYQGAGQE
jgi:hypothetical protein